MLWIKTGGSRAAACRDLERRTGSGGTHGKKAKSQASGKDIFQQVVTPFGPCAGLFSWATIQLAFQHASP